MHFRMRQMQQVFYTIKRCLKKMAGKFQLHGANLQLYVRQFRQVEYSHYI